jgi:hypothetical protein
MISRVTARDARDYLSHLRHPIALSPLHLECRTRLRVPYQLLYTINAPGEKRVAVRVQRDITEHRTLALVVVTRSSCPLTLEAFGCGVESNWLSAATSLEISMSPA